MYPVVTYCKLDELLRAPTCSIEKPGAFHLRLSTAQSPVARFPKLAPLLHSFVPLTETTGSTLYEETLSLMIDYPDRDDTELRAVDSVWLVLDVKARSFDSDTDAGHYSDSDLSLEFVPFRPSYGSALNLKPK
ncbi:uncharacterized protein STEHIDRAFT_112450 [Stereum hirsutum FP-91666 SS1]|uniref:uncharacterized protein n=1 Tax=Stereum hirsutum (strain FP-91666) TaxID=721885 RepID=UPI000444976B|nr:uncharacterized protein STEHIDRAFT_112450 [Stereum hirsutum FP-91666 SS1]EIM84932.1 hypothetical protein STEHIDRAFT_112450 [Stereum hirsutum FP-91666 SS1]